MSAVLVTGATGFLGRNLCRKLQYHGERVIALGRRPSEGPWSEFLQADLVAQAPLPSLNGVDTVLHLAGKAHALGETSQDSSEYFHINTEGTRHMLEASQRAGVRRFVFFSSVKAMGEGGFECLDETYPCHPETPYGASKLKAEELVLQGGYVLEPVVLRLSMVYGNSVKGNLPRMIQAIRQGRFPPLPVTGNKRSMVHVGDVVQAALLVAERSEAIGQKYIVTDGTPYSTQDIYEWICGALGKPVPGWRIPMPLLHGLAKLGDGIGYLRGRRFMFDTDALEKLIGSACYDSYKLEKELGFKPKKHLRESLPEIIRYLDGLEL